MTQEKAQRPGAPTRIPDLEEPMDIPKKLDVFSDYV